MNAAHESETLLDIYRTALTSEIMDSKQCDYYTDYCLYGMSDATEEESEKNIQPHPFQPSDRDAVENGEMWYYDSYVSATQEKKWIKFRMRPTEDQKQVVTGGPALYNRLIADDCETSASFIIGVHKTFMGIRAYMVSQELWDDTVLDHKVFFEKMAAIDEEVVFKLTGMDKTNQPNRHFANYTQVFFFFFFFLYSQTSIQALQWQQHGHSNHRYFVDLNCFYLKSVHVN